MAEQIEKLTADVEQVSKLSDLPNQEDGLTSAELKAVFDKGPKAIKEYVNNTLVPAINKLAEKLPSKVSQLVNDAAYITKAVTDLENYYRKNETYTQAEVNALVSAIPKFGVQVVSELPTAGISTTTVYLLPGGDGEDLYTEYIYVGGVWEILGCQKIKAGMTVTFSGNANSGYTSDKAFAEIGDALSAGTAVVGVLRSAALNIVLDNVLMESEQGYCSFNGQVRRYAGGKSIPIESWTAILHSDNTVEVFSENIVTTKTMVSYLPNEVAISSEEPMDENVKVWINPDEEEESVNSVRTVNGEEPDENGNVEIAVGVKTFEVTVTDNGDGTYTSSHTALQITKEIEAGKIVTCRMATSVTNMAGDKVYHLVRPGDGSNSAHIVFAHVADDTVETIRIRAFSLTGQKVTVTKYTCGVSSWNDLKDKPFYSETVEVLPETTVEIAPDMGAAMLPDLAIIADDECTIKYNGVEYVCVCTDIGGGSLALGNYGVMNEENPVDTGEPFVIAQADVDGNLIWAIMPLDGSASVTLSVIGQAHHPLPEKYLQYKIVDLNMTGIYDTFGNISLTPDMTFGKIYNACSAPRTLVTCYMHMVVDGAKSTAVFNLYSIAPDCVVFFRNGTTGTAVKCEYINYYPDGTCLYTAQTL